MNAARSGAESSPASRDGSVRQDFARGVFWEDGRGTLVLGQVVALLALLVFAGVTAWLTYPRYLDVRYDGPGLPDGPASGFVALLSTASLGAWAIIVGLLVVLVLLAGFVILALPAWLRAHRARALVHQLLDRLAAGDLHAAARLILCGADASCEQALAASVLTREMTVASSWRVGRTLPAGGGRTISVEVEICSTGTHPRSIVLAVAPTVHGPRVLLPGGVQAVLS